MQNGDYLDHGRANAIDDDVVGVGNEFACARYPPETVQIRVLWKLRNNGFDVVVKVEGGLRVALRNIFEDCS